MNKKSIIGLLSFLTIVTTIGCNNDNDITENLPITEEYEFIIELNGTKYIECSRAAINATSGTVCCIAGPIEALPGETIQFEYSSDLIEPELTWEVTSGKLTLLEGLNSPTATFRVGEGFTEGSVAAVGNSKDERLCGEEIKISLKK